MTVNVSVLSNAVLNSAPLASPAPHTAVNGNFAAGDVVTVTWAIQRNGAANFDAYLQTSPDNVTYATVRHIVAAAPGQSYGGSDTGTSTFQLPADAAWVRVASANTGGVPVSLTVTVAV